MGCTVSRGTTRPNNLLQMELVTAGVSPLSGRRRDGLTTTNTSKIKRIDSQMAMGSKVNLDVKVTKNPRTIEIQDPQQEDCRNDSGQEVRTTIVLSTEEIYLVEKTWRHLAADMTGRGMRIFKEIFKRNPQTKDLFPFRHTKTEDLQHETLFRGHASRFMQAIGAAVERINSLEQDMTPLLIDLGRAHGQSGMFNPDFFKLFKEVILDIFREDLGDRHYRDVEEAWDTITTFIMVKLQEGMKEERSTY